METNGVGPSVFDQVKENRKPPRGKGPAGGVVTDDQDAFPHLMALLGTLPKGAVKNAKTGRLGFYFYNGRLSCAVNVPSMRTCGYLTLSSFLDAFRDVEAALREGKVDWREDA